MSPCSKQSQQTLEDWVLGKLSPAAARNVSAHATVCEPCGRELALLRRERAVFAERARDCPLTANERARLWSQVPKSSRVSLFRAVVVSAFIGVLLVMPQWKRAPTGVEALNGGTCGPASFMCEAREDFQSLSTVDPVARVQAQFSACLMATPGRWSGGPNVCL